MAITLTTKPATGSYNFCNDPFIVKGTADSAVNIQKRVVAYTQVTMMDGTIYNLPELFYDVGADDLFEFNFQDNFKKLFERIDHSFPEPGTTGIILNEFNFGTVAMAIAEFDGAEHAFIGFDTFSCYLIRGGISWEQFYSYEYLTTFQPANKNFLNWESNDILLLKEQDQYLTFLQPSTITGWKVKFTFYNNNGTSIGTVSSLVPGTTNAIGTYTIPVGYTQNNMAALGYAAGIYRWTVQVLKSSDDSTLSEIKSFKLYDRHFNNKRFFFYENSLGGVSSLFCTGESELSVETTKTVVSNYQPVDYSVLRGQRKTINVVSQTSIKVQTGFKSRDEIKKLQDQLRSAFIVEIVEVTTPAGTEKIFLPLELTATTVKVDNDNSFLHALELIYKYNFKNSSYTPL